MTKLLVVGFDGATFNIIRPLIANGRLPTLAHLLQNGAWGTLTATVPPITPTAWTTVFTGKNPGQHGIYDFQELDPRTYGRSPVATQRHRHKTVWDLLGDAALPAIISDVPFTYPPRPLHGLMLTGYGTPRTPSTIFTHPADLAEQLPASLRPYVRVALPQHDFDRSPAFLDEWRDIMNGRRALLRHLITQRDWSLFFHVFSITDNLAHIFWTYLEPSHPNYGRSAAPAYRQALFDAYEQCDQLLGDMLDWAGADTRLLLMSDHGFGSVYPRQYLFQRLVDGGYLHYQASGGAQGWLLQQAIRTYNRLPFLREWIKNLRPSRRHSLKQSLNRGGLLPGNDAIDYAKSRVLPSDFGLQLWLNRQDRFAHGIVDAAQTAVLQSELATYLQADRDPATHLPIIRRVYSGAELYSGTHAASAPDLIIEHTDFYRPDAAHHPSNPRLEGSHTPDGILVAFGSDIQPNELKSPMSLVDLAPTMLHLLNQPVPPDMNGRVLTELLQPNALDRQPVQHSQTPAQFDQPPQPSTLSAAEAAELTQQLRQLGYIE